LRGFDIRTISPIAFLPSTQVVPLRNRDNSFIPKDPRIPVLIQRADALMPSLQTTARNLALDAVRRQQVVRFEQITDDTPPSVLADSTDVVETVSKQQELELLTRAIQSLPERARQVFTVRTAYGLTQQQIADRLGVSLSTVEKQMTQGIRLCAEYFAGMGHR